MEYVEGPGIELLSRDWAEQDEELDRRRRNTFFRDLSRMILRLAHVPFPRIGSLTLDHRGVVQLTNRPLNFRLQQLENKGVPTDMDRETTFSSTEAYYSALLTCHDNRILYQANSLLSRSDGETQLSVLVAMRALLPRYATRRFREGPFFFTLIDVHPNNVFVDADWRIKSLIDLEWACVRPVEMLLAPVWLTGRRVDMLPPGKHLDTYLAYLEEFFDAFDQEQGALVQTQNSAVCLTTDIMRKGLESGQFWFLHALDNPKTTCKLFFQHILPRFNGSTSNNNVSGFRRHLAYLWNSNTQTIIDKKLKDRKAYDEELNKMFESCLAE